MGEVQEVHIWGPFYPYILESTKMPQTIPALYLP